MLHRETVSTSTLDLLTALSAHPVLADFSLAGGTSLALRFGHRISEDLDFFTGVPFDNGALVSALKRDFPVDDRRRGPTGVAAMVAGVKVDFVKYPYSLIHPPETLEGIRLLSLHDVAAMKLSAVTNRGARKDFYDLHMLIEKLGLPHLISCYQAKFPSTEPLMLLRSLSYFADAEMDDEPQSLIGLSWEEVKQGVTAAVKTLL